MRAIPLTQGKYALVDDEDYERVSQFKWTAKEATQGCTWYAYRRARGRSIHLHRFILDAPANLHVDHKNHDGLDCRKNNMRLATPLQSTWNRRQRSDSRMQFKGVVRMKGKYTPKVYVGEHQVYFGTYNNQEDAARVYDAVVTRLRGEFAHTNFPDIDPEAAAIADRLLAKKGLAA